MNKTMLALLILGLAAASALAVDSLKSDVALLEVAIDNYLGTGVPVKEGRTLELTGLLLSDFDSLNSDRERFKLLTKAGKLIDKSRTAEVPVLQALDVVAGDAMLVVDSYRTQVLALRDQLTIEKNKALVLKRFAKADALLASAIGARMTDQLGRAFKYLEKSLAGMGKAGDLARKLLDRES